MLKLRLAAIAVALSIAGTGWASLAQAESNLDRIIKSGTLRCGVMLDSPPSGFRNAQNEPDGFDVTYCQDMAAALEVKAEIVETPSPDRIPALVSNRIDIAISSMSNTVKRGLTVAFSQPYMNYTNSVLTRKDAGIVKFADMKGHKLGGVNGTSTEQALQGFIKEWNDANTTYTGYANDADSYLALQQGKVDAIISATANIAALIQTDQFPEFMVGGLVPTPPDLVAMAVPRGDQEFVNWVKLFIWNQVASGRFQEVYNKYMGPGEAPPLTVNGVEY